MFMPFDGKEAQFLENRSLVTDLTQYAKNDVELIVFLENLEKADRYVTVTPNCYELMVFPVHSQFARANVGTCTQGDANPRRLK
jgi:hypothetical protein